MSIDRSPAIPAHALPCIDSPDARYAAASTVNGPVPAAAGHNARATAGAVAARPPQTVPAPGTPRAQRRRATRTRSRDDFLTRGIPAGDVNRRIRPSVKTAARSGAHARSQSQACSHARNAHRREASNLACSTLDGSAATTAAVTAGRARAHSAPVRLRGVKRPTRAWICSA